MQGEREVGTGSGNKWPWCSGGMGVVGEPTKVGQTADETHIFKVEEGERGDRSR
jgi:hypothetical protein